MSDVSSLASKIDAEFSAVVNKIKSLETQQLSEEKERHVRLEQLAKVFDDMTAIWRPRLELLVKKFGDRVKVTPRIVPSTREATFEVESNVARIKLKFSSFTDRDVRKLILGYDLDIIPVLMKFTPHAETEFPLDKVDKEAAAKWIDDRVVDFVRTYLALGENEWYMKEIAKHDKTK